MHPAYVIAALSLVFALALPLCAQTLSEDQQVYERFRAWASRQPPAPAAEPDIFTRYRDVLRSQGLQPAEVERQIRVINEQGDRLEIERWNQILTSAKPTFNTAPNAFLVQIAKARKPGTALDVGMGQGRNAIYLAQQGWTVTGFDPAERAVAAADEQARRLGVIVSTQVTDDERFEWGANRWDMIVLSYVSARHLVPRVLESLRPGGVVVVEAFHRDATKNASIGGGVVFDSNELPRLFDKLRIIYYEDTAAVGDFGAGGRIGVVRLAAEKPQ